MLLVSYIQQYFNTSWITVLTNQVWKLLIALFKVPNTGALTVKPTNKSHARHFSRNRVGHGDLVAVMGSMWLLCSCQCSDALLDLGKSVLRVGHFFFINNGGYRQRSQKVSHKTDAQTDIQTDIHKVHLFRCSDISKIQGRVIYQGWCVKKMTLLVLKLNLKNVRHSFNRWVHHGISKSEPRMDIDAAFPAVKRCVTASTAALQGVCGNQRRLNKKAGNCTLILYKTNGQRAVLNAYYAPFPLSTWDAYFTSIWWAEPMLFVLFLC